MPAGNVTSRSDARQLGLRVVLGIVLGAVYVVADTKIDARLGQDTGALAVAVERIHQLIDFVLPIVTGAALGVAAHYLRLRATMAAQERRRAEELRTRLHKVERDQAVWVVAASLLHDLKNPLHTLGLVLDEAGAASTDADRARAIEEARAAGDRMRRHLDALRALPSLARPDLCDVDVAEAASEAARDLRRLTDAEDVHLRVHGAAGVRALVAPSYLAIVLQTLVENSVDALRERRGPREIDVEIGREGDRPTLRIRDSGPGIPDEGAGAIFEPLATTKSRGLGLGLPIARALARAMRGDLTLESAAPTTFRLELCAP